MDVRSAVSHVDRHGLLLVFPVNNKKEPRSLWAEFFPRTKMRWEWDESGDDRVSRLWRLREKLSRSGKVVYGKWYRGRATLCSLQLFPALLAACNPGIPNVKGLGFDAREILDLLDEDSPVSTKRLKAMVGLSGRANESRYDRALRELWSRGLIAVQGEVDEGAFPSIALGSTRVLFEDLWVKAVEMGSDEGDRVMRSSLKDAPSFARFYEQLRRQLQVRIEAGNERGGWD